MDISQIVSAISSALGMKIYIKPPNAREQPLPFGLLVADKKDEMTKDKAVRGKRLNCKLAVWIQDGATLKDVLKNLDTLPENQQIKTLGEVTNLRVFTTELDKNFIEVQAIWDILLR